MYLCLILEIMLNTLSQVTEVGEKIKITFYVVVIKRINS
jgi:hypothetical protein